MDFFRECASLKKPIPKHFFTSLLNNLSTKDLVTLANLLSIKFMKPKRQLYATLGMQSLGATKIKEKNPKPSGELSDDRVNPKTMRGI
jgi:hypothetical protein